MIEKIKATIEFIHQKNCLQVDGNELNYLMDRGLTAPYFIDVDSYQTPSFPATAIMPSIRDWKAGDDFTEITDWFGFAIITFQLFVGCHPYKGEHPKYGKYDLIKRMQDGVSVFDSDVTMPKKARPIDLIPKNYSDWYYKLFQKGERDVPPVMFGEIKDIKFKISPTQQSTNNFDISVLKEFDNDIIFSGSVNGVHIVKTKDGITIGKDFFDVRTYVEVLFTPASLKPIFVKIENNTLKLHSFEETIKDPSVNCKEIMIVGNNLFVLNGKDVGEISFNDRTGKINTSMRLAWEVHPNASEFFSGVIYQNIVGTPYLTIPVPRQGKKPLFYEMKIPELEGYRILDAKHDDHVCIVIGNKKGIYDKFVFRFNDDYSKYDCRIANNVDFADINFVVLPTGIAIAITEDDKMEIFSINLKNVEVRTIDDPDINSNMRLCKDGTKLQFIQDNRLYNISMR